MKEKMVELLKHDPCPSPFPFECPESCKYNYDSGETCFAERYADYLLANGLTFQQHGRWLGEGDGYADGEIVYDVWYCSECNNCIDNGTDDPAELPKFCSECGAKMDGAAGTFTGLAAVNATDNYDACKWKRSAEELPKNFVSVLGYIPSAAPMPTVRECYTIHDHFFFPALNASYSAKAVTKWRYMPGEPKEEANGN